MVFFLNTKIYIYIYIKIQFSDLQIVLNNINQFQINFSRWTLLENLLLFTYWFYFKQTFLADQMFSLLQMLCNFTKDQHW